MRLGLPATVVASSSGSIRWSGHGDRIIRGGELVCEAGLRCSPST